MVTCLCCRHPTPRAPETDLPRPNRCCNGEFTHRPCRCHGDPAVVPSCSLLSALCSTATLRPCGYTVKCLTPVVQLISHQRQAWQVWAYAAVHTQYTTTLTFSPTSYCYGVNSTIQVACACATAAGPSVSFIPHWPGCTADRHQRLSPMLAACCSAHGHHLGRLHAADHRQLLVHVHTANAAAGTAVNALLPNNGVSWEQRAVHHAYAHTVDCYELGRVPSHWCAVLARCGVHTKRSVHAQAVAQGCLLPSCVGCPAPTCASALRPLPQQPTPHPSSVQRTTRASSRL